MIKDMLQEDLKALVHRELKVVVREELGDRLDRMEQQLAKVSDLQVQMAGLESSIQFASKRIDDLYSTSLSALAAHVERATSALALQTLDIDVHRRKWALTVQGLKGAAKEDETDTRATCVQLAKDNLTIDDPSVREFAACHRLSQKADAGIIILFCDVSRRNMWLANARHLRGSANHVSISPDVPPVLRPIKKTSFKSAKTCRLKKRRGPSSGTSDSGPTWTSLSATTDLSDRISRKRQLFKVSWVQTLCLAFRNQMLNLS